MEKIFLSLTVVLVTVFTSFNHAQAERRSLFIKSFAVFKVSYLSEDHSSAVGGIAGTAFFAATDQAYSAYHVMGPELFRPNEGYDSVKVWLIHERREPVEVTAQNMRYDSSRDLSTIVFDEEVVPEGYVFESAQGHEAIPGSSQLSSQGYVVGEAAEVSLVSSSKGLRIKSVGRLPSRVHHGMLGRTTVISLKSLDLKLENVPCLELGYGMYVGMSGGPTLIDGKLVAVNSFGFPAGESYKKRAWAVLLSQRDLASAKRMN